MKDYLEKKFTERFLSKPEHFIDCGGRFEVLGNHTDHNHGLCIAATCDLKISSALTKRTDNKVIFYSEGNMPFEISLDELEIKTSEYSTSQGLIRGIARYLSDLNYKIGGFTIYLTSTIFPGAGVSSSAAFELLIGKVFNVLFNDNKIDILDLCKAGQYSENNYFNKKSGLLDQIGVGYGGLSYIDFENIKSPYVKNIKPDFKDLHFVIVNTGGSHAHLSHLYSAIPEDMLNAAKKSGHDFLREGNREEIESVKAKLTDMEYLRALHYYGENERVKTAYDALGREDLDTFLACINESRRSSTNLLQNMMVEGQYVGSPLEACDLAIEIMEGTGACKINGGGFAGSIICLVKEQYLDKFVSKMSEKYGNNNVKEVHVRNFGPTEF